MSVVGIEEPIRPTQTGVERSDVPYRVLLQFDHGRKIELHVHAVLHLIEMLAGVVAGVVPSEHVMSLGDAAQKAFHDEWVKGGDEDRRRTR